MEETITILRVDTGEAVTSVQDLRDNVKLLKDAVSQAEIGSKEYQDALKELKVNQAALKDAMYGTTASMEDVAKAANGVSDSYNGLVNRMAQLKAEFRATTDAARRMELGAQINAINTQLKEMDALQGNFQRNVGNYAGDMKKVLGELPSFMAPVKGGLDNINKSMGLLSKNPLLGIITLLFPLITKITDGLKDNKTAIDAVDKAMKALQPVFNVVTKAVETLAGWLSKAVDWMVELLNANKETFSNIVAGAVGVGNALLQYLLTPIRTIIEAAKGLGNIFKDIFTGDFKKIGEDASAAFGGIKDAFSKGFDFKQNFAAGKEAGAKFVEGLLTMKPKAKKAGSDVGKAAADGMLSELDKVADAVEKSMDETFAKWEKEQEKVNKRAQAREKERLEQIEKEAEVSRRVNAAMIDDEREKADTLYQIQQDANQRRLEALQQFVQDAIGRGDLDAYLQYEQEAADLSVEIELQRFEREREIRDREAADMEERAKQKVATMEAVVSATSGLLGSLADMYEASADGDAKAAKRVKGLRIAAATIDMLQGAVTAYSTAQTLGVPLGPIVGAANAAAVIAAGMANISKIRSTQVEGGSTATPTVTAPRIEAVPQQTTVIQGDSAEARLNRMAEDQKVYILQSDIEAAGNTSRVQVRESSF